MGIGKTVMTRSLIQNKILECSELWLNRSDDDNAKLNVLWLESQVLENAEINLESSTWIFSHVPKTAGTALESYLIQAFALKDVLNINANDLNNMPESLYMKNRYPKFITGYHPLQGLLYQILGNNKIVHLSMMRDPIERVVSTYNHLITKDYRSQNISNKALDFDDFINHTDLIEVHNGQAKRFAGILGTNIELSDKEIYFRAKYSIDHCFSIVGVTEFFSQFHKLIAKRCGVIFHDLPPITRLETKVQLANIKPDQMKVIKRKNKIDIQLYQYVRSKFLNLINS